MPYSTPVPGGAKLADGRAVRFPVLSGGRRVPRRRSGGIRRAPAGRYSRNSVAKPRKMKNPPLSVMAVMSTLEPSAGSRPSFWRK
jgi:hypothetical protein